MPSEQPHLPNNLARLENIIVLYNCVRRKELCSGDILTQTHDPEMNPLPSFALLEMQWILHRVAALSGAADDYDNRYLDDDDDGILCPMEDPWLKDEDGSLSFQYLV